MFKMILSAIVALGLGSIAYAQEGGAPAGEAPKMEDAHKAMGDAKDSKEEMAKPGDKKAKHMGKHKKAKKEKTEEAH